MRYSQLPKTIYASYINAQIKTNIHSAIVQPQKGLQGISKSCDGIHAGGAIAYGGVIQHQHPVEVFTRIGR